MLQGPRLTGVMQIAIAVHHNTLVFALTQGIQAQDTKADECAGGRFPCHKAPAHAVCWHEISL